jgi:hypothetical protein
MATSISAHFQTKPLERCDDQRSADISTVELRAALVELRKHFEQFLNQADK